MDNQHNIHIPEVFDLTPKALDNISEHFKKSGIKTICLVHAKDIFKLINQKKENIFKGIKIVQEIPVSICSDIEINKFKFSISNLAQAIVGLGGGTAIDFAKLLAYYNKLPFISVPTSLSNDGIASPVATVSTSKSKVSVFASMPSMVIIDTTVIKKAPSDMLISGVWDLISNITAVADWELSHKKNGENFNPFAAMVSKMSAENFLAKTSEIQYASDEYINQLAQGLFLSGISMEIAQSSRSASGAEHLISHGLDYILKKPFNHGIQVGIGTLISYALNNKNKLSANFTKPIVDTDIVKYLKAVGLKNITKAINLRHKVRPGRWSFFDLTTKEYSEKDLQKAFEAITSKI